MSPGGWEQHDALAHRGQGGAAPTNAGIPRLDIAGPTPKQIWLRL
jgi:hypothetical protein